MYHVPVLLEESLEALALGPGKKVADLTFGGGGHAKAILAHIDGGHLFGFDQDPDARANAEGFALEKFTFVQANFRHLKRYMKLYGVEKLDGILADLGVSSHQIDEPERGFSIRSEGLLGMRMDAEDGSDAGTVVNTYTEQQLVSIFRQYGELPNARQTAREIVKARVAKPIATTLELRQCVAKLAPKLREAKYLAQVFQALRIEVNDELGALKDMLGQAVEVLAPGGRLVVISYHSLEDRLVKNFMKAGSFDGQQEKDLYGNLIRPLAPLQSKPVVAGAAEKTANSRSRAAKLRAAVRL